MLSPQHIQTTRINQSTYIASHLITITTVTKPEPLVEVNLNNLRFYQFH
jgi:hypothetical protein